ncbi:MAG: hypothetical protein H6557_03320 [Lewinellaceae bacterium]|nr:hypothetical protein [Phaeodactylibacter sp.]MCB9035630.1 hypothetical protein [Lewinellaceae bacterium]
MEHSKRFPVGLLLIGAVIATFILLIALPKTWEEATRKNPDGSHSLSEEWEDAIDHKKDKIENQELYKLVAKRSGMYLCKHCPTGKFYLYKGELYRYGTTGDGKNGRGYTDQWEEKNKLEFFHISFGDEATVKKGQAELIGTYALDSENMRHPLPGTPNAKNYWYRLVLPPGNNNLN